MELLSWSLTPSLNIPRRKSWLSKKRKGILDGVCISGGEPTLAPELPEFLSRIRELGYDVKLDTNGSRPSVVKISQQLT